MSSSKLKKLFLEESREHVDTLKSILALEEIGEKELKEAFRLVHSLKGMGGTIGLQEITNISHEIEKYMNNLDNFISNKNNILTLLKKIEEIINVFAATKETKEGEGEEAPLNISLSKEGKYRMEIFISSDTPMIKARAFSLLRDISSKVEIIKSNQSLKNIKKGVFKNPLSIEFKGVPSILENLIQNTPGIIGVKIVELKQSEEKEANRIKEIKITTDDLDDLQKNIIELFRIKNQIIPNIHDEELRYSFENRMESL